jgi:hypothetical protein
MVPRGDWLLLEREEYRTYVLQQLAMVPRGDWLLLEREEYRTYVLQQVTLVVRGGCTEVGC